MALGTSLLISCLMFLFGRDILSLFISAEELHAEEVLQIARHYLMVMSSFLAILYATIAFQFFCLNLLTKRLFGMYNTYVPNKRFAEVKRCRHVSFLGK